MKVGLFGQFYHEDAEQSIKLVIEALQNHNAKIYIEKNFFEIINKQNKFNLKKDSFNTFEELDSSFNLFFSIGGDGTILKSVTFVRNLGIPIVGVNTGRLGFLATLQREEIKKGMEQILNNQYIISNRSLLSVETIPYNPETFPLNFALNEIAINRKNTTSMIKVDTQLNGEHLTSYWSDGLIVSTPTGSTGYSLSCGGPIVDPESSNLIITPIAAHNLNARPLVVPDHFEITLKVSGREDTHLVSLDSRITTIQNRTSITIKKSPFKIKLVQLKKNSFTKTLRQKLLWGEDKRN